MSARAEKCYKSGEAECEYVTFCHQAIGDRPYIHTGRLCNNLQAITMHRRKVRRHSEPAVIRSRVRSGMANARAKGKQIGRPQITVDNLPSGFLRHYPAYKSGHLNISELARVCDLSRTTIYKYIDLLEG